MTTNKIKLFISYLFIGLLVSINGYAQKNAVSFLHITDTHLLYNLENYDEDIVHHREYTREYLGTNDRFHEFMMNIPDKTNSDFIIHTGDMIDFYNSTTRKGDKMTGQIELFARHMNQYHHPFFMTIGNHDIFSYDWGNDKVIPNQLESGEAIATWIRNFDCFREGTYYSRGYQVGDTKYRLIFLDNGYYRFLKEDKIVNPYIDKPQMHWLKNQLETYSDEKVIILMHIPFSDQSLLAKSKNELYQVLSSTPSVKLILGGHYHTGVIKQIPAANGGSITQVGTDAMVRSADNWRLINLLEDGITVSSTGDTEIEVNIKIN